MPVTKEVASNEVHLIYTPIKKLQPYAKNAKKHPKKQVHQIMGSIKKFGFINPIIIDENKEIIAGHGRFEAAKKLGIKKVPTISVEHLSEAEVRAYRLADNQLTLNSGYDDGLLKIELTELTVMDIDLDIGLTGFETAEIDRIIESGILNESHKDDAIPEIKEEQIVTKLGDTWMLDKHELICGDALKISTFKELLGKERADMVFTDPPYNVPIDGHVCGNGKIKHDEFVIASGEMTDEQFVSFLYTSCANMSKFSRDGSLHYVCIDWRGLDKLIPAGKRAYSNLKNICVWNKDNGGMGSLYRSKHEMVAVFKNGTKSHINNIELGKHGRYRTNVWDYKGVNSFGHNQSDLKLHPTVKPVAMIADAIKDCTKRGQIVLDPFAGSGSTLIAAEKTGRIARCIELDPKYCDVIIRRWQKLTGKDAINDSFDSFNEIINSNLQEKI